MNYFYTGINNEIYFNLIFLIICASCIDTPSDINDGRYELVNNSSYDIDIETFRIGNNNVINRIPLEINEVFQSDKFRLSGPTGALIHFKTSLVEIPLDCILII